MAGWALWHMYAAFHLGLHCLPKFQMFLVYKWLEKEALECQCCLPYIYHISSPELKDQEWAIIYYTEDPGLYQETQSVNNFK